MRPFPARALVPATLAAAVLALAPARAQDAAKGDAKVEPTAHPLLWQIEGEAPSFLYGTIHLPEDRVLALPPVVEAALDRCEALFTEIPTDMQTQMGLMPKLMLPQGQSLNAILPADLKGRVEAYLKAKGMPMGMAMFGRFKPWVLTTTLGTLDYLPAQQQGKQALDAMLYARAQRAGKRVGGLETPAEQLGVFDGLTLDEQLEQLRLTLDQLEKALTEGKRPSDELLEMYLAGDLEPMQAKAEEEFDKNDLGKKLRQTLVVDRNIRMADRIEQKLKESPGTSFFFAVGSLHYPGEQGILKLLEAKGLKVRRLTDADAAGLRPAAGASTPAEGKR